jgi:protein-disulfide isomerase
MPNSSRTLALRSRSLFPCAALASFAALAIACATLPASAQGLSETDARARLPRADFTGLTAEQRGQLVDLSADTFDYAGCNSTLAACLRADVKDKHAPRMAKLAGMLLQDGVTPSQVIFYLEQYYASFAKEKRKTLRSDDCPTLGEPKAPISVVEYSDYQCPHCAAAVKPLHDLIDSFKGKLRLCAKYFPLPGHSRAKPAAEAAEAARAKGKFWELNEQLFGHQEELEDANLKAYARQVGLDGDALLKEVYASKYSELIERHTKEGMDAGVRATPSLFFNGRLLTLPVKVEYLAFTAEDELEWLRNGGAWDKE